MAMGIVSDIDFLSELSNSSVPVITTEQKELEPRAQIIDSPPKGRGENNVEVPNTLRKLIGSEATTNGRESALELASNLGISPSSVSAYSQGATSTASYEDRPNLSLINQAKERISKRARGKLMLALHHITKEKLVDAKVKDLAGIARDMSAVIKNIEPEDNSPKNPMGGPTFIFYSPQFRKEEHFEVIQAKE
jgi:hypothetical protein